MSLREIGHVHKIPYARAVGSLVIVPQYGECAANTERGIDGQRQQVSFWRMCFADFAPCIRSGRVELSHGRRTKPFCRRFLKAPLDERL